MPLTLFGRFFSVIDTFLHFRFEEFGQEFSSVDKKESVEVIENLTLEALSPT